MLGLAKQDKPLKVFGYVRLSRDEDKEQNSLTNQKDILLDFAQKNNYTINDMFEDDNVTGMIFDRPGLNELKNAIENNVDKYGILVLVKDLSRLGRHKAYTALFLDELRSKNVMVYSVTENINNFNENDDLVIGIKQILNEQYTKDISRKVKSGFKQKQKKEGLVIVPPFGYIKKDDGEIVIDEERAEIVRLVYKLYLEGYGYKKIAQHLTDHGYKTPSWYRNQDTGMEYQPGKRWVGGSVWSDRTISRMIRNDAYKGTLRCGTTERSIIYRYRRYVPKEKHFVHKNYYPLIIDKKTWELAQAVRKNRTNNNIRASKNSKIHRYAGLLECVDCGACFVAKKRKCKTGIYIEYVCNAYHRFGTSLCTSHRIKESELDDMIYAYLHRLKGLALDNLKKVDKFIQEWNERKRDFTKTINKVQDEMLVLKEDMKAYAKQLARDLITEDLFQELTQETKERIELLEQQLATLDEAKEINNNAKLTMQNSYDILTKVLDEKKITNAQIQMLINKICIRENKDGTLSLDIKINMPFKHHLVISNTFTEATSSWVNDPSVEDTIIDLINVFSAFDKIAA